MGAVTILLLLLAFLALYGRQNREDFTPPPLQDVTRGGYAVELADERCRVRAGDAHFSGTVINRDETRAVRRVRLRGTLLDEAGRQVNTGWNYADSDRIPPGASSTYSLWIDMAGGAVKCRIQVESAEFTD